MAGQEALQQLSPLTQPRWQIMLLNDKGQEDITQRLNERLVSLTITDKRGVESDELCILLDDDDGALEIPRTGVLLSISIGWAGQALTPKGLFKVDELEYSGVPFRLNMRCRAANVSASLQVKKERSWHQVTLGNLVAKIASEHGLTPVINAQLSALAIAHIDQTNESDAHFLTRIAKQHDAIFTVKSERLLLMPAGQGKSASGKDLPSVVIKAEEVGDDFRWRTADRAKFTGVKCYWHDPKASKRKSVLAGTKAQVKCLRDTFPNADEAKRAAQAELKRLQRGQAQFSMTLSKGRADIGPETLVRLQGIKPLIDETPWVVVEVTHNLTDGGFTTSVELETTDKKAS